MQFGGTAHGPGAAEGDVAASFDVREAEMLEDWNPVIHWVFVVPLVAEAMDED